MSLAPVRRPTCALVVADPTRAARNAIPRKVAGLGVVVKKEYQPSRRYDGFDTVDLVIAVRDHLTKAQVDLIEAEAALRGRPLFFVPHQRSSPDWARVEAYLAANFSASPASVAAPSSDRLPGSEGDEHAEIVALYESERDEARRQVAKMAGEIGTLRQDLAAARADRQRSESEAADLRGKLIALEQKHQAAVDGAEERGRDQALADATKALEAALARSRTEREAAVAANAQLLRERDAARARLSELEDAEAAVQTLLRERDAAKQEVTEYRQKYSLARAREQGSQEKGNAARAKLEERVAELVEQRDAFEKRAVAAERALAQRKAEPSPDAGEGFRANFSRIASAYRALLDAGAMTDREAFDKLADVVTTEKKGRKS